MRMSRGLNDNYPFPHTAILQQTTFRKILNVHSAERNEHFFKLESFENIVAKDSLVTMFSSVVCCSRHKNDYLWSKGLNYDNIDNNLCIIYRQECL